MGEDGTVRTWDVGGSAAPAVSRPHGDLAHLVRFSPDGRHLATGGIADGLVRFWTLDGHRLTSPVDLPGQTGLTLDVAYSSDGVRLATLDAAGVVRLWNVRTARVERTIEVGQASRIAMDDTGRTLLSSGSGGVRRWDLGAAGPPTGQVLEPGVAVGALAADGGSAVTAADDGWVRLRDRDGRVRVSVPGHSGAVNSIQLSPDGRRVASLGPDSALRAWAVPADSTAPDVVVVVAAGEGSSIQQFLFTPDGSHLLMLGDAELTGIQVLSSTENTDPVLVPMLGPGPVAFHLSPDGRTVASLHADGTARLWECEVCGQMSDVLALGERRLARDFTAAERRAYLLAE